ncbi:peptide-methionine (R)-S-oxide reductase MsrB [Sphingomonas sp. GCM10030256]|uniref:peptide-methionine (R)-S-oxide reductase MsrB n=1 Tax=Sphingomonas sp. GCM10030256 TaxID=3273427 RepID=UPI0036101DF7
MDPMNKRSFLGWTASAIAGLAIGGCGRAKGAEAAERFEVTRTPTEWKRLLGPQRYAILREAGTERAGSSPLDKEHRKGIFVCAGCALPLYGSAAKYDSGTGWPSFFKPLPNAVRTKPDKGWFVTRTEVHCRRCGGHLGHVFDDGPPPTGKRYCMNGLAMRFVPGRSA